MVYPILQDGTLNFCSFDVSSIDKHISHRILKGIRILIELK